MIFKAPLKLVLKKVFVDQYFLKGKKDKRTNGPVNAHLRTGICNLS